MVCFNCTRFLRIKSETGGGANTLLSPSQRGTAGKWLTVQINMILGGGTLASALFFYAYADGSMLAHLALDRKSTRLNSSHVSQSRMPSSA